MPFSLELDTQTSGEDERHPAKAPCTIAAARICP
jgi:hypothetical protein